MYSCRDVVGRSVNDGGYYKKLKSPVFQNKNLLSHWARKRNTNWSLSAVMSNMFLYRSVNKSCPCRCSGHVYVMSRSPAASEISFCLPLLSHSWNTEKQDRDWVEISNVNKSRIWRCFNNFIKVPTHYRL